MNYKIHPIVFIVIIATQMFAQANRLQISVNSNAENEPTLEFALAWDMNFNPTNGLKIETSQEIYLVPKSLMVNGKGMWLQNLTTIPEQDSVITWQSSPNGIILLFREDLIKNGDQLNINCNGSMKAGGEEPHGIYIKDVEWRSGNIEVSEQSFVNGSIPATPNR